MFVSWYLPPFLGRSSLWYQGMSNLTAFPSKDGNGALADGIVKLSDFQPSADSEPEIGVLVSWAQYLKCFLGLRDPQRTAGGKAPGWLSRRVLCAVRTRNGSGLEPSSKCLVGEVRRPETKFRGTLGSYFANEGRPRGRPKSMRKFPKTDTHVFLPGVENTSPCGKACLH